MSPTAIPRVYAKLVLTGAGLALVVVVLGAYVRLSDAGLGCPDWPGCYGRLLVPDGEAFVLWRGLGIDYENGVLGDQARVAIHVAHRLGAVLTALLLAALAITAIAVRPTRAIMRAGRATLGLLGAQLALGVGNVVLSLPLAVATAHNGVAALLLLSLMTLLHLLYPAPSVRRESYPAAGPLHGGTRP